MPFIGQRIDINRRKGSGGIPFSSDLSALYEARSGDSLIDTLGGSPLNILTPVLYRPLATECAYIVDNGDLDILSNDFTLCGWVKSVNTTITTQYLFGKIAQASTLQGRYGFYANPTTGYITAIVHDSTGVKSITSTVNFFTQTWYFLQLEVDNVNKIFRFFINNVQIGSDTSFTGTFPSMASQWEFCIGAGNNSTGSAFAAFSKAYNADTYIFHKILTAGEKLKLLAGELVTGAIAHYDCALRDENILLDLSGNGYHLTGVNLTLDKVKYDIGGSRQGLDIGYTRYYKAFNKDIFVNYLDTGIPSTYSPPSGYAKDNDYIGNTLLHNGSDSKISLTGEDRSDTLTCTYLARNVVLNGYYDSGEVTHFHFNELFPVPLWNCFYNDYNGRYFSKISGRLLSKFLVYATNKTIDEYDIVNSALGNTIPKIQYSYVEGWRASRGLKVVRFDDTTKILYLSLDGGVTFNISLDVSADVDVMGVVHIFENGNIVFSSNTKMFYSTDNLSTYSESSVYDITGSIAVTTGYINQYRAFHYDYVDYEGTEMLVFGSYVVNGTNEYNDINVFYSIDNGLTFKSFYKFDTSSPLAGARHVHAVSFNSTDGSFWVDTGDTDADECNWLKFTYNKTLDTWSGSLIHQGSNTSYFKNTGMIFHNNYMYWSSDSDNSAYKGVWRVPYADVADTGKFERIFYCDAQLTDIRGNGNGELLITISRLTGNMKELIYSKDSETFRYQIITGGDALNTSLPHLSIILNKNSVDGYYIVEQITTGETFDTWQKGQKVKIKII